MAVYEPATVLEYGEGEDPRQVVFDKVLPLIEGLDLYRNEVLVVTAPTPIKSKGGIYMPSNKETRFQGKIGLVAALGEIAFKDDNLWPREVICVSTGETFASPSEAAWATEELSKEAIISICEGYGSRRDYVFGKDKRPKVGTWVFYRAADTRECAIGGYSCRFIDDNYVLGRCPAADSIR
jgi:co-chaperonin GroES (HSP10)